MQFLRAFGWAPAASVGPARPFSPLHGLLSSATFQHPFQKRLESQPATFAAPYGLVRFFATKNRNELYEDMDEAAKRPPTPEPEAISITVPKSELDIRYARSGGAGGQNVNKVETKAEVRFNVGSASWIPAEVKARLIEQQGTRINKDGELIVTAEKHRTQKKNLEEAISKLQDFVNDACITPKERSAKLKLNKGAREKRLTQKKQHSDKKKFRSQRRFDD